MQTIATVLAAVPSVTVTGTGKPEEEIKLLADQVRELSRALQDMRFQLQSTLDNIYTDLSKGKSRHQIFTAAAPTVADLDLGEIAIYRAGAPAAQNWIYTRTTDAVRATVCTI